MVEALREGVPINAVYVAEGAERDGRLREAFSLAQDKGISLLEVSKGELDRMTVRGRPPGPRRADPRLTSTPTPRTFSNWPTPTREKPLIVVLDSITDPRNLGAVVRSASGFGAHGVVIPERRAAGMTASAWKTSAGAAARIPVAQTVNLTRQLKAFQDAGCMVIGLAADGDLSLPQMIADRDLVPARWSSSSEPRGMVCLAWWPRPATTWCRSRWPPPWSR